MQIDGTIFLVLLGGAVASAIAGFLARGLSQFVVGPETAELVALPLLFGGFLAAAIAFSLAVLVTLGVVTITDTDT